VRIPEACLKVFSVCAEVCAAFSAAPSFAPSAEAVTASWISPAGPFAEGARAKACAAFGAAPSFAPPAIAVADEATCFTSSATLAFCAAPFSAAWSTLCCPAWTAEVTAVLLASARKVAGHQDGLLCLSFVILARNILQKEWGGSALVCCPTCLPAELDRLSNLHPRV
jgi:hypothetical protein